MTQRCANLEEATEKYLGKLVRIRRGDDTFGNEVVGVVIEIRHGEALSRSVGYFVPQLRFVKKSGEEDAFFVDWDDWVADIYGEQS